MVLGGRLRISVGGGAAGTVAGDSALYRLRVPHPTANTYSHRKSSHAPLRSDCGVMELELGAWLGGGLRWVLKLRHTRCRCRKHMS